MAKKKRRWGVAGAAALLGVLFLIAGCSKAQTDTTQTDGTETGETTNTGYEVLLPDDYETSGRNYPVAYVMPQDGYTADDSGIGTLLQKEMEAIIVMPVFEKGGDVYSAMEACIQEVDASYRTIPDKKYRMAIGTGTGGYLAYLLGLTEGENAALKESKLFASVASIRGDFVSDENPWYGVYGNIASYIEEMHNKNEEVFDGFYTYIDAPVDDAWTNLEDSTNDIGALFIGFGTSSAVHEFTVRTGGFTEEFLAESVTRAADRVTKYMLSDMAAGTVTLEKTTLPKEEKNAKVNYTIVVSEAISSFTAEEITAEITVSVTEPNSGEVLAESVLTQTINGAGSYSGETEIENLVNGASSEVGLSWKLFGAKMGLGTTTLIRSEPPIIEGAYQKINLAGDWYFNYVGTKETIDPAALTAEEYEAWPVVQPGVGHWKKGYGNVNDDTVSSPMGPDYFDYMIVGSGYYVKAFEVPEEFGSRELILSVGYVDDRCEVFLNGTRVGTTGMDENGKPTGETTWAQYSKFEIDPDLLKRGETNTIVVRAWNDEPYGAGGWYGGPVGLYSKTAFENQGGADAKESRFEEASFTSSYAASALKQGDAVENKYLIYLPKDYDKTDRYYPTVYLLHQFNSDHTSYKLDQVDQILDRGVEEGLFDEMIVVVPNSEENSWWAGDWERMITDELIPLIDANYRTIKDARYRLTAGCSMGGQGAYGVALRNPDYFTGAISFFGAFSYGENNSPNHIAAEESAEFMDYYTMYFICGNQDSYGFGVPAIELNQLLEKNGIEHGFFIENGGHDGEFYLPYFDDAFAYVRNHMYQSDDAVEQLLSGTITVDAENGVQVTAEFAASAEIEKYFHTIPESSYTKDSNPQLSVPLTIQVVQDEQVVYEQVEKDYAVSAESKNGMFEYDLTEYVDTAKPYTIVYKAAIFDRVVTLQTVEQ